MSAAHGQRLALLVVAPFVPFEGIPHAGGAFLLRHLERLAATCDVTLLAPGTPTNLQVLPEAPSWLRVVVAPLAVPAPRSLRGRSDRVVHRLRGWSLAPHEVRDLLAAGLLDLADDASLVEVHWPEYAHLVPVLRRHGVNAPCVVVDHDVASQAERRRVRGRRSLARRLWGRSLMPLHRQLERRALDAADRVLVFKRGDADLLGRLGVRTPVRVIDPWLDPPAPGGPPRDPRSVLFTGALWRSENDQAARWLVEQVWPQVLDEVPDARLVLAGAGPRRSLQDAVALARSASLTGRVPDLGPCYESAAVFAAPLHTGGGLKFKVPQAMLHGLPVVATSVAAEGVVEVAPPGTFWGIADSPSAFAAALVAALRDPDRAAATGARAAAWCRDHYSFARSGEELLRDYAALVATSRRGRPCLGRPALSVAGSDLRRSSG